MKLVFKDKDKNVVDVIYIYTRLRCKVIEDHVLKKKSPRSKSIVNNIPAVLTDFKLVQLFEPDEIDWTALANKSRYIEVINDEGC